MATMLNCNFLIRDYISETIVDTTKRLTITLELPMVLEKKRNFIQIDTIHSHINCPMYTKPIQIFSKRKIKTCNRLIHVTPFTVRVRWWKCLTLKKKILLFLETKFRDGSIFFCLYFVRHFVSYLHTFTIRLIKVYF